MTSHTASLGALPDVLAPGPVAPEDVMIVGCVSDDPFAIDVARYFGQAADIADLLSLKQFANSEFCPRFISDEADTVAVGNTLAGKTVVIVSTCCGDDCRNSLAMKTFLVSRAAKDNGAERVILVEPDLFYSAQDRGPRPEHGEVGSGRDARDYKKFDGQPWSARLYARLLRASGVDAVVTLHNHSAAVERLFAREFGGGFHNLSPADVYAHFLLRHDLGRAHAESTGVVLCAPDAGAGPFVVRVRDALHALSADLLIKPAVALMQMRKTRSGERRVTIDAAPESATQLGDVCGQDVIVFDDMVRTGHTIVECCRRLKEAGALRVLFVVTHFYSSDEVKENLNDRAIDEIITTNSLPVILNRDMQGRLRRKMLVLKLERWIAQFVLSRLCNRVLAGDDEPYDVDISSKNPRWVPHEHLRA